MYIYDNISQNSSLSESISDRSCREKQNKHFIRIMSIMFNQQMHKQYVIHFF